MANARSKNSSSKKSGTKSTAKSSGRKSQTQKKTSASRKTGKKTASQLHRSNQLFAVILFAGGVLLTLVALFNGPVLWGPPTRSSGASAGR